MHVRTARVACIVVLGAALIDGIAAAPAEARR